VPTRHLTRDPAGVFREGQFFLVAAQPVIQAAWHRGQGGLHGVLNVAAASDDVSVWLPDGAHVDLLSGETIQVQGGRMAAPASAIIARSEADSLPEALFSSLLDYRRAIG